MDQNVKTTRRPAEVQRLRTGRDELNLIDFPIGTMSYKQPQTADGNRPDELRFSVKNYDADIGSVVPKTLTIRTSSQHGFPTPKAEELLVGLLLLTRLHNNFSEPRVEFYPGELFRLMGWPHNGSSKRQLLVGLDRLSGVKLKYENSWGSTDGKKFEKVFHTGILDSYQLTQATGNSPERKKSWVHWSSEVFADIQSGNVKELNTEEFFSLRLPLARRLYRFLDKHLHQTPILTMDLIALGAHLGISETSHIGKIKERLRDAVEELEQLSGFIEPASWTDRFVREGVGQWTITFGRPGKHAGTTSRFSLTVNPTTDESSIIVRQFYNLWAGEAKQRLTSRELQQAEEIVGQYSFDRVQEMLPLVVKDMRTNFADARAFGATMNFWPIVANKLQRKQQQIVAVKENEIDRQNERRQAEQQNLRKENLRKQFSALPDTERDSIRAAVAEAATPFVRARIEQQRFDDPLVELACLDELERRSLSA